MTLMASSLRHSIFPLFNHRALRLAAKPYRHSFAPLLQLAAVGLTTDKLMLLIPLILAKPNTK